ncbi:MAG: hypothetical protein ABSF64_24950 [Bryobacteraceae bacterium]
MKRATVFPPRAHTATFTRLFGGRPFAEALRYPDKPNISFTELTSS